MVVKAQKQTPNKFRETLCIAIINHLRSYVFLRIDSLPEKYFLVMTVSFLLNVLSSSLFMGIRWSLLLYTGLILLFCTFNCLLLSLSEGVDVNRHPQGSVQEEEDHRRVPLLILFFYFYITLLGLSYLPLYVFVSNISSFLKPVALIVFIGFYNIFFLNNSNRGALTQVINAISIFVFVYLCIDNMKLRRNEEGKEV